MKKIFSVFLTLSLVFCMSVTVHAENNTTLRYGADGKFTILQITDPQDDHHPSPDMLRLISLAIEESDPDLVVFSGDIVEDERAGDIGTDDENGHEGVSVYDNDGNIVHDETLANVRTACAAVFNEVETKGIPFAVALGNNDYQSGISSADWLDVLDDYDMNLTTDMSNDDDNRVDCNLNILSSSNQNTAFAVWIMDTKTNSVTGSQLDWFASAGNTLKSQNDGVPMPSMVFQHIPVDDMGNLFEYCHFWDPGALPNGLRFLRLNKDIANGYYLSVQTPGRTTDEFSAWKADGGVLAAFFGHLHTEGYSGKWDGIELGLTYGSQFAKSGPYGVRVLTLNENDPANYVNEQYVYEGSVACGNAKLVKEAFEPYPVYDNFFETIYGFFVNTFIKLWQMIVNIF